MGQNLLLLLTVLVSVLGRVAGYCAGVGANPGFISPPLVQQISLTSALVSWRGLVSRIECADQFLVKSWVYNSPNEYKISDLLTTDTFHYVVDGLWPGNEYMFQVVAREDKGLLGKDWNKSPPERFTTSPSNPTIQPPTSIHPVGSIKYGQGGGEDMHDGSMYDAHSGLGKAPEDDGNDKPLSMLIIVGLGIAGGFLILLAAGGLYNTIHLARARQHRAENSQLSGASDSSESLHLEIDKDRNWRSSRRSLQQAVICEKNSCSTDCYSCKVNHSCKERQRSRHCHESAGCRAANNSRLQKSASRDTVERSYSRDRGDRSCSVETRTVGIQTRDFGCTCSSPVVERRGIQTRKIRETRDTQTETRHLTWARGDKDAAEEEEEEDEEKTFAAICLSESSSILSGNNSPVGTLTATDNLSQLTNLAPIGDRRHGGEVIRPKMVRSCPVDVPNCEPEKSKNPGKSTDHRDPATHHIPYLDSTEDIEDMDAACPTSDPPGGTQSDNVPLTTRQLSYQHHHLPVSSVGGARSGQKAEWLGSAGNASTQQAEER